MLFRCRLFSVFFYSQLCFCLIDDVSVEDYIDVLMNSVGNNKYIAHYKEMIDKLIGNLTIVDDNNPNANMPPTSAVLNFINDTDPDILKAGLLKYLKEKRMNANKLLMETAYHDREIEKMKRKTRLQGNHDAIKRRSMGLDHMEQPQVWDGTKLLDEDIPTRRIMNGYDASIDSYGFMVSVRRSSKYWCSGVLLRRDFVLTTAHCLQYEYNNRFYKEKPATITVKAGCNYTYLPDEAEGNENDRTNEKVTTAKLNPDNRSYDSAYRRNGPWSEDSDESSHSQEINLNGRKVEDLDMYRQTTPKAYSNGSVFMNTTSCVSFKALEFFFHPNYDPPTLNFNFALIRLEYKFMYAYNHTMIIELFDDLPVAIRSKLFVLGWGSNNPDGGMRGRKERLQLTMLQVFSKRECIQRYGEKYVTENMFCAGSVSGKTGGCNHDAGGAAINSRKLVGLLSSGSMSCGELDSPNIFSRVGSAKLWIEKTIASVPKDANKASKSNRPTATLTTTTTNKPTTRPPEERRG